MARDLLPQRVPTLQPATVWVADITSVPTDEGWLYVAGVLDRCTRCCLGWALADTLATTRPLAALDLAFQQRHPGKFLAQPQTRFAPPPFHHPGGSQSRQL